MFQERLVLSWVPLDRALPVYLFETSKAHPPKSSFGEGLCRRGSGVAAAVLFITGGDPSETLCSYFFLKSQKNVYACI